MRLQTILNHQLLRAGDDSVYAIGKVLKLTATSIRQAVEIRVHLRIGEAGAAVWHLVVDLGDLSVPLLCVTRMQKLIKHLKANALRLHIVN